MRPEYTKYWKWFEQRLNYSKTEYEKVQEWLNSCLAKSECETHDDLPSPVVLLTNPADALTRYLSENKNNFSRQISYLIMRPKSVDNSKENFPSSISLNLLSVPSPPEPLHIQQDHIFPSIVHHLDSFINYGVSPVNQLIRNQSVRSNLNEEKNNEEHDVLKESDEISFESFEITKENQSKIFQAFLRKRLRHHGLTRTFDEIREILLLSLSHALLSLQMDNSDLNATDQLTIYHLIPYHHKCLEIIKKFYHSEGSVKYGVQSEAFISLGLPSYRPLFIYLNNVILEIMHLCIQTQNENKGVIKKYLDSKFSLLSIEVLTSELRECIEQAILVRQTYYHMIYTVFEISELDIKHQLERDLFKYDDDLKITISIYLDFITNWVQDLIRVSNFSKALWVLENEWHFCRNNLYFVTATEDIFASRFCNMGILVFESLINSINIIDSKYKEPLRIEIDKLFWDEKLRFFDSNLESMTHEQFEDNISQEANFSTSEKLNLDFNEFKEEINNSRKWCIRALQFTAEFLTDLELASKYQVVHSLQALLDKLHSSEHVLVNFTNKELQSDLSERSFLIFVPREFSNERIQIARLLFLISAKDNFESTEANKFNKFCFSKCSDNVKQDANSNKRSHKDPINVLMKHFRRNSFMINSAHNKACYLLFLQLNDPKESWTWAGNKINLYASRPVKLSLYQHLRNPQNSDSDEKYLYLVTSKQSILTEKKIELKQKLQDMLYPGSGTQKKIVHFLHFQNSNLLLLGLLDNLVYHYQ
ncbi:mitogen-activated kinase kinase kinase 4 [Brachionus plicatilis]|uniref:Mitogen-activated kinase kinase kinase 4 n=1 Tax=Brachionus plicatilis TaxID=10195 RepID=A0A3M7S177_BRAPC|nr:mitogen-activated kinase kinase kinase 4 [Brachionus plicatilis]